jgi:glycine/D-amino acid oxidase-like deaminating enzyme
VRVYLPVTSTRLARALESGRIDSAVAFAVTPALREWYAEGDLDELEYVALTHAARASLRLLAEETTEPAARDRRRVVLAADVPDSRAHSDPETDVAAVRVEGTVEWSAIVSAHVDDVDAANDVLAAVRVLEAADAGDDDARFVVESVDDHQLQWFATQEIAHLIDS